MKTEEGTTFYEIETRKQTYFFLFCPISGSGCIAQTDALQYKAKMDEDFKSAWDSYLKLCYLSASDFFTSMVEEVGLVSPFKDGCIKDVVAKLEKKLGL